LGNAAKIILIGATSLIVGIFAVSLKRVQLLDAQTAFARVKRVQTERIEDAALRVAVYRVQANVRQYRDVLHDSTALNVRGTRTALGGGTYYYDLYVPRAQYYANGTVTVSPPGEASKTIKVRVDRMSGINSLATGTKPGYRRLIRGEWQMTKYFVYPLQ
jgi:hypothetical protein